jgi:hypothetical protein
MTDVAQECVHYWVLETEGGNTTPATCKKCGAKKSFKGFISYGADTMRRVNQMNALEKRKQVRVGIHLPGSPLPRAGEQAW